MSLESTSKSVVEKESVAPQKETKPKKSGLASILFNSILSIVFVVAALVTSSYVITDTWDFGGKVQDMMNIVEKKAAEAAVQQGAERIFTAKELLKYDGSDESLPIYLAINGKVYDVTKGRNYYGPGGGYSFFSGRDAARAYITGCFETHLTHDLRGLTEKEIESLDSWTSFYEKSSKYHYVGRVIHDPIPEDAPIPEPCNSS